MRHFDEHRNDVFGGKIPTLSDDLRQKYSMIIMEKLS